MANTCSGPERVTLTWQPTLASAVGDRRDVDAAGFDASFADARRIALDDHAWVDHAPGWARASDALFEHVVARAPWEHRSRRMYDRIVEEPRLTAWHGHGLDDPTVPSIAARMAATLSDRYGRTFDALAAALYRDGLDSVAWHSDRIDPTLVEPVIAIVSLGSARTLRLRPRRARGAARRFRLLSGDLFVMGGATNATWEHSVPKVAHASARVSLQFRHST